MKRLAVPFALVSLALNIAFVVGMVMWAADQPAAPVAQSSPTYGPSTIDAPSNFDALLENKAGAGPVVLSVRYATLENLLNPRYKLVTITPTPTQQIGLSPTSTIPPTNTPRATATNTPTRTATAEIEPSPTQGEDETLEPIPSDTPVGNVCYVRTGDLATYPLRNDHRTTATKLADVPGGTALTAQAFYVIADGRDEWVKITRNGVTGWVWIADDFFVGWDDTEMVCATSIPTEYASGPTNTPVPTQTGPTPTSIPPVPTTCLIKNAATFNKNVRVGHSATSAVAFEMPPGSTAIVKQFYTAGADKWASVLYTVPTTGQQLGGWAAVTLGGTVIYQLIGDDDPNGPCSKVQITKGIAVGWHTILGAQWDKLGQTAQTYGALKTTDNTVHFGPWYKAINPDGYWIHRSIFGENGAQNCPVSEWEWYQPQLWIDRFIRTWPAGADAYEYINECGTGPSAEVFVDFNIRAMEYMNSKGYCSLAFSFAAGVPDYPEWPALLPVLEWIDQNPCKTVNGQPVMNGVALHGSFCSKDPVPGNDWVTWRDLCDRHWLIRNHLLVMTGYDWRESPMIVAITEDGWDGGRGGTNADPAITTEFAMGTIDYSLDMYEVENLVDTIIVWNIGTGGSNWIDRWYFIEPLAALLRSRALE